MTLFEFLMVIAGVVIAIAMAEIVSGWGRMMRAGTNVKFDWLHLGWSLTVLLNAMLYWVGVWAYAELEFQYVAQTWFLVASPNGIWGTHCIFFSQDIRRNDRSFSAFPK